jgi:hypothetical protein
MRALAFVLAFLWAVSAQAEPEWASKPVQCASVAEVNERQAEEGLTPFIAGVTKARIENNMHELPWIMFYDQSENGYYSLIEYNLEANYACQILIGAGLDFSVMDDWLDDPKPRDW